MVQLYILMNGFDLHPLYYEGFYRLGCTICPSLADWEITLLKKRGRKIYLPIKAFFQAQFQLSTQTEHQAPQFHLRVMLEHFSQELLML
ncbi:phosphoadenosine phosphosulfate reductase domain-containing protein [Thermococcus sp.]